MNCPNCNVSLVMSDRQGIEIDYCPQCRGIWLDRGELDKIIEKSAKETQSNFQPNQSNQQNYSNQQNFGNQQQNGYYKDKKKKSWLNELFD